MTDRVLYDSHMHTPLCKHAQGEPEAYAAQAERRGLKGIIFTCHNPGPKGWSERVRMSLDEFDEYVEMVARARAAWNGRVDVLLGLESDYIPGIEPFLEKLHAQANLHFVLGSVHPQLPYYKDTYYNGDEYAFHRLYFKHLAMAAESGLYDCLSHPDLVKNSFPEKYDVNHLLDDILPSLDRVAATGVAMELNTSGLHKRIKEMNPGRKMLAEMYARRIPIVLGSDAHSPNRVAADFENALETLADVGYETVSYFINREPHQVAISEALASLNAHKRIGLL